MPRTIRWLWAGVMLAGIGCTPSLSAQTPPPTVQANDNRTPGGTLTNGVLTLHLEVINAMWSDESDAPLLPVQVFREAGRDPQAPGPLIRVPVGTRIEITIDNRLDSAVTVHGLHERPGRETAALEIAPQTSGRRSFNAGDAGTYLYWASARGQSLEKRNGPDSLLTGAIVVDDAMTQPDRVFVLTHMFGPKPQQRDSWNINGRSWPGTERLTYTVGEEVHWRIVNGSYEPHPLHLHGTYFTVDRAGDDERDTRVPAADRFQAVTDVIGAGHTRAISWSPQRPGRWLFHCHILFHVMPELRDAAVPWFEEFDDMPHEKHMSGLVLGITALPARPAAVT